MSELRNEIVESQKARTEFLKWKLIGVSALGAAGLGLTEHAGPIGAYLVLALIPFVCFYVDLLCRHISLRILVIGRFLRFNASGEQRAYEQFAEQSRQMGPNASVSAFALEDWALDWSTCVLSGLVAFAGLLSLLFALMGGTLSPPGVDGSTALAVHGWSMPLANLAQCVFVVSGAAGIVLTLISRSRYARRVRMLNELANDPNTIESLMVLYVEANRESPSAHEVR
jgi:hypothetical protein